jgi:hypothetical protein
LRLTIHGIRASTLSETLKALGWRGNDTALRQLQQDHLHDGQKLVVGVDYGEAPGNRIGIEIFDPNVETFLKTLNRPGRVDTTQYGLLHQWEKAIDLPLSLRTALSGVHRRPVGKLYTRINHFKFVIGESDTITTKGYLYYCF